MLINFCCSFISMFQVAWRSAVGARSIYSVDFWAEAPRNFTISLMCLGSCPSWTTWSWWSSRMSWKTSIASGSSNTVRTMWSIVTQIIAAAMSVKCDAVSRMLGEVKWPKFRRMIWAVCHRNMNYRHQTRKCGHKCLTRYYIIQIYANEMVKIK